MTSTIITPQNISDIKRYFGLPLEAIDEPTFKRLRKALRAKYHPDKFEQFEDATIREMATERFQLIEMLSEKIAAHLANSADFSADQATPSSPDLYHQNARFSAKKLKVEIRTADKALKFALFGKRNYKWLLYGERFKIPNTTTYIVMDENHYGNKIGYQESIRMYLSFGEEQATEDVANWIYQNIEDRADSLIIAGEKVLIDPQQILLAIRQQTFLRIA
ncbi:MAG: hypothetical protein AAF849_22090 [Bacteroidota bacterium]